MVLSRVGLLRVGALVGPGRRAVADGVVAARPSAFRHYGKLVLKTAGAGAGVVVAVTATHLWLEREGGERWNAMQMERAKVFEEHRQERDIEIAKLLKQSSYWRIFQLFFSLLPIAIMSPLWLIAPKTFWGFVAVQIDGCGPTFVKLAQWLSTRRDIFPEDVCASLSVMHNQVHAAWSKPVSAKEVETNLRAGGYALKSLEPQPHASGSIAEVFFGVAEDGSGVAVKCLRPGVRRMLEADLSWLLRFGQLSELSEWLRLLGVKQAAEEFVEHVQMQTDFRAEAANLLRFRANFASGGERCARFPAPLFVSQDTLVLSREEGEELAHVLPKVHQEAAAKAAGLTDTEAHDALPLALRTSIAQEGMACYMRMIFVDAFVHGDLHPGNIMLHMHAPAASGGAEAPKQDRHLEAGPAPVNPWDLWGNLLSLRERLPIGMGGLAGRRRGFEAGDPYELVILDAGLAIPLRPDKVEALRSLAISIIYGDFYKAASILYECSPDSSRCSDPEGFKQGLAAAFRNCRKNVWEEGFVQVSDACLDSLNLVQKYQVGLDTALTWTLFGMLSVEGSARQLDPQVDCAGSARRYILTGPAIWKEFRDQSWETSTHMLCEMCLMVMGVDYWEFRHRMGFAMVGSGQTFRE